MDRAKRFLPDPLTVLHYLTDMQQGFSTRPDVGVERGLIARMLSWYQGDPIVENTVTSTGTGNIGILPVVADAQSCTIYVSGNDIYWRLDGTAPNAAGDQVAQEGSIITLTGYRTLTGFQFIAVSGETATLYVTYFT